MQKLWKFIGFLGNQWKSFANDDHDLFSFVFSSIIYIIYDFLIYIYIIYTVIYNAYIYIYICVFTGGRIDFVTVFHWFHSLRGQGGEFTELTALYQIRYRN